MSRFQDIKAKFKTLPDPERESLLRDIYQFSNDMKLFLEGSLLGNRGQEFLDQMEKEILGKVYRDGMPGTPNGKTINSIISKAKKSALTHGCSCSWNNSHTAASLNR